MTKEIFFFYQKIQPLGYTEQQAIIRYAIVMEDLKSTNQNFITSPVSGPLIPASYEGLLAEALQSGIIDIDFLREQLEMKKRKELLDKHSEDYSTWVDKDGYWNTYIPDAKKGRKRIKKHTKREMEQVVINYYSSLEDNPTINEIYNAWITNRYSLKKIQTNTLDRYNFLYKRHFSEMGQERIRHVGPRMFEEFLEEQIVEFNLTAKGFANLKGICRGFLLWAKKRDYINWNVSEMFNDMDVSDCQFKHIKKEDSDEVYNDIESVKLIRYLYENPSNVHMAILLLYLTGMRVGEVVCIKKSDIADGFIKIRHTESRVTKENADITKLNPDGLVDRGCYYYYVKESPKSQAGNRDVLIPTDFCDILYGMMEQSDSEYLFTNEEGERLTTNSIRRRLTRINNKLGIRQKSPHKLRKTYASILLDNHLDNNLIISLMGHTDISMTEDHYHRGRRSREQKSAIVSNLAEFKAETYGLNASSQK